MSPDPQGPPLPEAVDRSIARALEDGVLGVGLERPPARPDDLAGLEDQVVGVFRWLRDIWKSLMAALQELQGTSPLLYWLVMALLLLILVGLIWHIIWTLSRVFGRGGRATEEVAEANAAERLKHHQDLLGQARQQAAAGRYRDAVRSLNLALLALCEERGSLRFARSWTLREVLRMLQMRLGRTASENTTPENATLENSAVGNRDIAAYGLRTEAVVWGVGALGSQDYQQLEADALRIADAVQAEAGSSRKGAGR